MYVFFDFSKEKKTQWKEFSSFRKRQNDQSKAKKYEAQEWERSIWERIRKEASVRWPSLTEPFASHSQGQGPTLKQPASITRALCCVFNSPVKSINSYPSDWLELINMAMQDANGRWGRSEMPCQTLALQGQNCSNLCCAEPDDRIAVIVCCQDTPLYCLDI